MGDEKKVEGHERKCEKGTRKRGWVTENRARGERTGEGKEGQRWKGQRRQELKEGGGRNGGNRGEKREKKRREEGGNGET